MTREEWNKLEEQYANAARGSGDEREFTERWQRDVIRLLVAICEELWSINNNQPDIS